MESEGILNQNNIRLDKALKFREIVGLIFNLPEDDAMKWAILNLREPNYMIKKKYEQKTDDYCVIYEKLFKVSINDINIMKKWIDKRTEDIFIRSNNLRTMKDVNWNRKNEVKANFALLSSYIDEFKRLNRAIMLLLEIRCSNTFLQK